MKEELESTWAKVIHTNLEDFISSKVHGSSLTVIEREYYLLWSQTSNKLEVDVE